MPGHTVLKSTGGTGTFILLTPKPGVLLLCQAAAASDYPDSSPLFPVLPHPVPPHHAGRERAPEQANNEGRPATAI